MNFIEIICQILSLYLNKLCNYDFVHAETVRLGSAGDEVHNAYMNVQRRSITYHLLPFILKVLYSYRVPDIHIKIECISVCIKKIKKIIDFYITRSISRVQS